MTAFTDAWRAALVAEYQAVFGYALLGPRLPEAEQGQALACQTAHEGTRDAVETAMAAVAVTPAPAAADYPALYPVTTATQALTLAARLEDDCAEAWRLLYLAAAVDAVDAKGLPGPADRRREAQAALSASAVRAARWRKTAGVVPASRPFPGI